MPDSDQFLIPYGTPRLASAQGRAMREPAATPVQPGAPHVTIDRKEAVPLRLNSIVHAFTRPPVAQNLAHATTQLTFLQDHITNLCGDWNKPQRLFVSRYFDALRNHVLAAKDKLEKKLSGLEGLCELEHWCFSALMPLPRAHLCVAPADFTITDFAFWDGQKITAVFVNSGNTLMPKERRTREQLTASGIEILLVPASLLRDPDDLALLHHLGSPFKQFWKSEAYPSSPFRGMGLADPTPLAPAPL